MNVPLIIGPDTIISSNYKQEPPTKIDKPVDQEQLDGQLQISFDNFVLKPTCTFDLTKLETRRVEDLQQETVQINRIISEQTLRSIITEELMKKGEVPLNIKKFAIKTICKKLDIPEYDEVDNMIDNSVTLDTIENYHYIRNNLNKSKFNIQEHLSGNKIGNLHDDPLYNMLVIEAQQTIRNSQRKYKEKLIAMKQLRKKIERFLYLVRNNAQLQKRIEDSKNKFIVQSDILTQLYNHIKIVDYKRELIKDQLLQLKQYKEKDVQLLKVQRNKFNKLKQDLIKVNQDIRNAKVQQTKYNKQIQIDHTDLANLQQQLKNTEKDKSNRDNQIIELAKEIAAQQLLLMQKNSELGLKLNELKEQRKKLEQAITDKQNKQKELDDLVKDINSQGLDIKEKNEQLEIEKQKIKDIQLSIDKIQGLIDAKQLDIETHINDIKLLQKDVDSKQTLYNDQQQQKLQQEQQDTLDKQQQIDKNQELDNLNAKKTQLETELSNKKADIVALQAKLTDIKSKIDNNSVESEALLAKQQQLAQEIGDAQTLIDQNNKDIADLQTELDQNKSIEAKLKGNQKQDQTALDALLTQINNQKVKNGELDLQLINLKTQLQQAKDKVAELQIIQKISDASQQLEDVKNEQAQLQKQINDINKELEALGINQDQLKEMSQDQGVLDQNLLDINEQLIQEKAKLDQLQQLKDLLNNDNAKELLLKKNELSELENKLLSAKLNPEEQTRLQQLQQILGDDITQSVIDNYLANQRNQKEQINNDLLKLQELRDKLDQFNDLKNQKDSIVLQGKDAQDAKNKLISDMGVNPDDLKPENIQNTVQKAKDDIEKLQAQIDKLKADKTELEGQLPLFQQIKTNLQKLKDAQNDKRVIENDMDSLYKQLEAQMKKYDIGGIPDPKDLIKVKEYIGRLKNLQERAKLLDLQSLLDELKKVNLELNKLKTHNPDSFKIAMDQLIAGENTDLVAMSKEIQDLLSKYGLPLNSDPVVIAEEINRLKLEIDKTSKQLQKDINKLTNDANKYQQQLQKVLEVLEGLQKFIIPLAQAVDNKKMYVIPVVHMVIERIQKDINEKLNFLPNDSPVIIELNKMIKQLQDASKDLKPDTSITNLQNYVNSLSNNTDKLKKQIELIDSVFNILSKNGSNQLLITNELKKVQDAINQSKIDMYRNDKQLLKLASDISNTLINMGDNKNLNNKLGLMMSHISFSFVKRKDEKINEKDKNQHQFAYKSNDNKLISDLRNQRVVVDAIQQQIQAITSQEYTQNLIKKLRDDNISKLDEIQKQQLIQEVDDVVITVWIYDLFYQFRYLFQNNMHQAEQEIKELEIQIQEIKTQLDPSSIDDYNSTLQFINNNIESVIEQYLQEIEQISKLFYVNIQLPSKQDKKTYPNRIAQLDQDLYPFYKQYTKGLSKLLPDQLMYPNESAQHLSLVISNMQNAYTQTSIKSSNNSAVSNESFSLFLNEFRKMLGQKKAPIINLYNISDIIAAKNLDDFVRKLINSVVYPSQKLLDFIILMRSDVSKKQKRSIPNEPKPPRINTSIGRRAAPSVFGQGQKQNYIRSYKSISFKHVFNI